MSAPVVLGFERLAERRMRAVLHPPPIFYRPRINRRKPAMVAI